jgi:hypothetical protein
MRIGAKNSTPVWDRKHFLVATDARKGFISSVCATPGALSRGAAGARGAAAMYEKLWKTRLDVH